MQINEDEGPLLGDDMELMLLLLLLLLPLITVDWLRVLIELLQKRTPVVEYKGLVVPGVEGLVLERL